MEKKKIFIFILIQAVLIISLLGYVKNRHLSQYWFDGSQLVYIDVHEEDEQYRKICSPQVGLNVGSYEFKMVYYSSVREPKIKFTNCGSDTYAINYNSTMYLYEGEHEFKADFRVDFNLEGFSAIVYCPEGEEFLIEHVTITETNDQFSALIFYFCVIFLIIDLILILDRKRNPEWLKNKKGALGAIAIATFFSSFPLLVHYLMYGHDLEFHLIRIDGIATALANGNFPVRMHPNFMDGYGYPTGIYYPELFLYFPAVLHLVGIPLMTAYKWFLLLENIATAVIAWYAGKIVFKSEKYASLFCILYTLLPYRVVNEYYRAAVGESLAMMFLPLLMAAMYLLLKKEAEQKDLKKASVLLVFGVSGVLQSHILSCEIYAIFGIITVLLCAKRFFKPRVLLAVVKSIVWVMVLNLWFLVPFLEAFALDVNIRYDIVGSIGTHGLNVWQLLAFAPEATGNSKALTTGIANEMPLYLGWATVLCLIIGLLGIEKLYEQRRDDVKAMGVICFIAGCIATWMTTYLFPWNFLANIPKIGSFLQTIQFPWRYLSVAGGLILVAGLITLMSWKKEEYRKKTAVLLIGISLFVTLSFSQSMAENKAYHIVYNTAGLDTYAVMGEEYLYYGTDVDVIEEDSVQPDWFYREHGKVICEVLEGGYYYLPLLYYPWYEAKDAQTGEKLSVVKGDNNVAALDMPEGYSGTVIVSFAEPLLWKICTCISALSAILFILYVVCVPNKKWLFGKGKKRSNIA